MGNEVLSPAVAAATGAASLAVLAACGRRAGRSIDGRRSTLAGMMGALVFAAQMVNFPVPGGSSGHLGGGALLAIVLGPEAAVGAMAAVLFIQALVFNDGGLLALGANLLNIGIVPACTGALCMRFVAGSSTSGAPSAGRLYLGCFAAGLLGVTAGAALVPFQIAFSGLMSDGVSFRWFFGAMVLIHACIGAVEGIATFAVVAWLQRIAPDMLPWGARTRSRVRPAWVLASIGLTAFVLAGAVSLAASPLPDGLEYLLGSDAGQGAPSALGRPAVDSRSDGHAMSRFSLAQEELAPFPGYSVRNTTVEDESAGSPGLAKAAAGVLGLLLCLALCFRVGRALSPRGRAD